MSEEFERLLIERERYEQSLRRRATAQGAPPVSQILRDFFEHTTEPMFISTAAGRFLLVNGAFARLLGYSPGELLDIPVQQVYALPTERRRFRGTIESRGRAHGLRLSLKTRGGATVPVSVDAVVWHQAGGSTGGYMGVLRATSRQESIRHEMDVFDLAVRGANEGLWTWDLQTEEVRYSARWKAIIGFEDHEIHNTLSEWTRRIHPEDADGFRRALKEHLKRERETFHCHFRMVHRDGEYRWMLARGVGEFGEDGTAKRIAGSLTNVSAHLQVIERLKQEGTELQQKSQEAIAQRDAFLRFLPEELRDELLDRGEEQIRPRNTEAAVLHARVDQSAYYHAHLSPERFSTFMNEILGDLSDLIHGRRGVVARLDGDAVVAVFGAPARHPNDVDNAFACADAIRRYVETFNDVRDTSTGPPISISMGISHGVVFTGTTGNMHRIEFTCYGAPVRRAQILQTRAAGTTAHIMADREAAARASASLGLRKARAGSGETATIVYLLPDPE